MSTHKLLSIKEVVLLTGLSRSTIERLEKTGAFPRRIKISARRIAWSELSIYIWLESFAVTNNTVPGVDKC